MLDPPNRLVRSRSRIQDFPLGSHPRLGHREILWVHPMTLIREDHLEQQVLDQVVLFQAADGQVSLDVRLEADTVWVSQAHMAELFGRERSVITRHVGNVFREGELAEQSNVHFLHIAGADRPVGFYSLDVIISVGYHVKTPSGTQFRSGPPRCCVSI
ncbi:MAG: hypothetical protein ACKO3F_14180 [Cyanobium sp.]